jgi:hypothetical protein
MTWKLDPETGDVWDQSGEKIGQAEGPPYSIPADIRKVIIRDRLPSPNASASGQDVIDAISCTSDNCEFGRPE